MPVSLERLRSVRHSFGLLIRPPEREPRASAACCFEICTEKPAGDLAAAIRRLRYQRAIPHPRTAVVDKATAAVLTVGLKLFWDGGECEPIQLSS